MLRFIAVDVVLDVSCTMLMPCQTSSQEYLPGEEKAGQLLRPGRRILDHIAEEHLDGDVRHHARQHEADGGEEETIEGFQERGHELLTPPGMGMKEGRTGTASVPRGD